MLFESNAIHRVNGAPLYYHELKSLQAAPYEYLPQSTPDASPPYTNYDFLMSKLSTQLSPLTLTPPISPSPQSERQIRGSVIMKVENCQIIPANDQQVCRWENCYRTFTSLEKLANHVSMTHSAVGFNNLYYCKWEGCQRSERGFNARYKMLVHCRTHTKEKPHFCSYSGCTKAFSRAENLKIHFRSHTLEKPYKCAYPGCTKAYSNSSDRFKHRRTHENNKPYICKVPGCLKRYTDPSSLRKHVKTFNHESLCQSKSPTEITEDCKITNQSQKLYFNSVSSTDHSESNDEVFWMTKSDEALIEMANITLDQPLDLRIRHA